MNNFKSSKKYYYFLRFGLISIATILFISWILAIYFGIEISINGQDQIATMDNTLIILILPILLASIHFFMHSKIAYVQINGQDIIVESKSGIIETTSHKIESINQIQFVNPPMYKVKFSDSKKLYIFIINKFYLQFGGFVADLSSDSHKIKSFKD